MRPSTPDAALALTHLFSQRFCAKSRCTSSSHISTSFAKYALMRLPDSVLRSGNRHNSADSCCRQQGGGGSKVSQGLERQVVHVLADA
eukprot:571210-Pelagomonas_calceolata.AAC.1